jgi:FkbM family methyltransferase
MIDARRPLSGSPEVAVLPPEHPSVDRQRTVLLGVCNPEADVAGIRDHLASLGYIDVRTPVQASVYLAREGRSLDNYWLTGDVDIYARESERVAQAKAALADERSQTLFDRTVAYRRTGDLSLLIRPDPVERQYLGDGLPWINGSVRLLDLGAYTGDTIANWQRAGVKFDSVIALEPSTANFAQLIARGQVADFPPMLALPLAGSHATGPVSFAADGSAADAISATGASTVMAVAGDDLLLNWRAPTHVKMDIEGAEPAALSGLIKTLSSARPALAVSVYHRPDHLWSIVNRLADLDLEYAFHLRCYGEQTFDTVLYAIPRERERRV